MLLGLAAILAYLPCFGYSNGAAWQAFAGLGFLLCVNCE